MSAVVQARPRPANDPDAWELERLAELQRFDVLDSPREAFDHITRLIGNVFNVEIGIVSMIDAHRQWYKALDGLETKEAPKAETYLNARKTTGAPFNSTIGPKRLTAQELLRPADGHCVGR